MRPVLPRFAASGCTILLFLLGTGDALARAGGGGGAVESAKLGVFGVVIAIILLPFYLVWLAIKKAKQKVEDTLHSHQLHAAGKKDPFWDEDAIKARVEKVFFTVQRAWMARDQDIAREFVTQRLYDKHKLQTDILLEQRQKNMLENINLIEVRVVKVDDQADDTKDKLWTRIRGSMIDFRISEIDGHITGSTSEQKEFVEVWKFARGPGGWLLDEIDQNSGEI